MTSQTTNKTVLALSLLWTVLTVHEAKADIIFQVTADTTGIAGTAGNIDLVFNPGVLSQAASVQISGFTSVGGALSGVPSILGDVTGTLPGTVTIVNTAPTNDYFQSFTFGSSLQFFLKFTGPAINSPNGTTGSGSSFGLSFYDAAGVNPLLTVDPDGFAGIGRIGLDGTVSTQAPRAGTNLPPSVTFTNVTLPEPATYTTAGTVLLALLAYSLIGRARRRSRCVERS